jgi:hypothetical protein
MSQRPHTYETRRSPLHKELENIRSQARAANAAEEGPQVVVKKHFANMTATEVAAASLGAEAGAMKPISFMNEAHFDSLKTSNALSDSLARRLDAYKEVASADGL